MMKKLQVIEKAGEGFLFRHTGKYPCSCIISNIEFEEHRPNVNMNIIWIEKGRYSNLQRKKMLRRSFTALLRKITNGIKASLDNEKVS